MKTFIKVKAKLTFEVEATLDGYSNDNEIVQHFIDNYDDYLDYKVIPQVEYEILDDWFKYEDDDDLTPYDDIRDNHLEYMDHLKESGDR